MRLLFGMNPGAGSITKPIDLQAISLILWLSCGSKDLSQVELIARGREQIHVTKGLASCHTKVTSTTRQHISGVSLFSVTCNEQCWKDYHYKTEADKFYATQRRNLHHIKSGIRIYHVHNLHTDFSLPDYNHSQEIMSQSTHIIMYRKP